MGRGPLEDEELINEYKNAQAKNKKIDISKNKPTGNSIGTAKNGTKKII